MRGLRLEHPANVRERPLHMVELGDPQPGPGELLVRVATCAVCRTDLQLCEGDLPMHKAPIIPGHQAIGRIVSIGCGVSGHQIGDRVGIGWLASTCGTCKRCLSERENLCENARFTGWDEDGGYATHLIVRADFALPVPRTMSDAAAAPLLCGGVIGYRSLKISGIARGQRLGLYGFGASAFLTLQVARYWNCEVFVCTRNEAEQERARSLGAVWAGGYDTLPPAKLDAAITFAPVGSVIVAALRALDRGATLAINAIHLDRVPEFSYDLLWWERSLRSVSNYTRKDAHEFLALADAIPLRTAFEVHPLDDGNEALDRLSHGALQGAAVLVNDQGER